MQFGSSYLILVVALTTGVQATKGIAYECKLPGWFDPDDPRPQQICGSSGSWWKLMPPISRPYGDWGCCVPKDKESAYKKGYTTDMGDCDADGAEEESFKEDEAGSGEVHFGLAGFG
ncbi:unnamed protein product [Zymoseptoria tritici ST99CH_1E4]|uniref:Secreted protein n=1 Tax=Zymoseptoria tritici ST99CH_1E4 TaxID=1276532 RepID=A0A2H1GZM2_ZYMTR|nr:unnamed protein product [Zymoseptoria tritici ST99CH_1E4]